MTSLRLRLCLVALVCSALIPSLSAQSQDLPDAPSQTSQTNQSFLQIMGRDFVQEKVNLGACTRGLKGLIGCGQTIATGAPLHIAAGSLAPQNGVALGLAFTEVWHPTYCPSWIDFTHPPPPGHENACHWSMDIAADGQASGNESWRAGLYLTATHLSTRTPKPRTHVAVVPGAPRRKPRINTFGGPSPTVSFYSESSALNKIYYFGLGRTTLPASRTDFGFSENITGINTVYPVNVGLFQTLGFTLLGEANGRFPSIRGSYGDTVPSIEASYTEASAPGLISQPKFLQTGEGIRLVPLPIPLTSKTQLKLNYLVNFQQFVAPSDSHYSFRRFTTDLNHTLTLYKIDTGHPMPPLPPAPPGAPPQPVTQPISPSRDLSGTLAARMFIKASEAGAGRVVPFYFSPTIGGSDIDGRAGLASYPDYRFRGPDLLLLHGDYEQSLGKIPVGLFIGIDEAKVGLHRDDISFNHLRHSYSAGLTIHAGGLPAVYLLFAWGGGEDQHFIGNINSSLLGVSTRPSLY